MLGRIERLLEGAVEGTTRGLFRVRLEPVELAKAATRAMDGHQIIGPDGPEVANAYRIRLHPEDFAKFAPFRASLETKIVDYLDTYARDRALRPVAAWQVDIVADEGVPRRRVRVDADMIDPALPDSARPDPARPDPAFNDVAGWGHDAPDRRWDRHADRLGAFPDGTVALPSSGAAPYPDEPYGPDRQVAASVTLEDGRVVPLDRATVTIGRALDNDVVVSDSRVSRYHVRLEHDRGGLVARDVGSTNGTRVGTTKSTKHVLRDGDELSLGGYVVRVRLSGRSA